ncbi:hypothetical protein HU200_040108 [Digitaria exilis]|uniref:C2 domain-containing protein n=1 Tax=Digitaria exilis TaxID=1010633 RepID=A0A835B840_9POAL|nr:hypothetical protein HU200_040108 [Digitaria exilis]CAB3451478.1 unnamed protein product [Digitaria exilis]
MSPPRPPSSSSSPLLLLEITVISAQDLHRRRLGLGRRTRVYAVAWADEAHKLRTGVDLAGGESPTWNDRFLFRVDDKLLRSDTAAVTVEVRAAGNLLGPADTVLGLTRIVVSTFVHPSGGRQVAALLLRRPRSLRPQGIVNVAVALLDDASAAVIYDEHESPDAFAVKDLVVKKRTPASLCRIAERGEESEAADEEQSMMAFVDHSGRLQEPCRVEQRKLELKLEKWKADLSPPGPKEGRRGGGRRWGRSSCFRGSGEWER